MLSFLALSSIGCNQASDQAIGITNHRAKEEVREYRGLRIGMSADEVYRIIREKTGQPPEKSPIAVPGFENIYFDEMHLLIQDGKLFHIMPLDPDADDV